MTKRLMMLMLFPFRWVGATIVLIALAALLLPHTEGTGALAAENVFRAGAFAIDVTPTKLPIVSNGSMRERMATKIVDPLHARCLVLDDGTEQIAIAVVDNCVIPRSLFDEAKRLAHEATGIRPERMLMSATHTHTAPSVYAVLGTGQSEEYIRYLPGRIAKGIETAWKNLAPARIGWAIGRDPTNVFCRRYLMKPGTARTNPFGGTKNDQAQMNPGWQNPNAVRRTGPADPDVAVLSVQTRQGQPIALFSNYSTHYAGSSQISADYFGIFCNRIGQLIGAEKLTPPFVGIMSNGTSGDANCCDFDGPRRRKFTRFTVAEDVARAAYEAYKTIEYYDWVPLVMEEKLLTLGVRMPSDEEVRQAKQYLAENKVTKPQNIPEVYARETVFLSQLPPTRELKLQAIRIGTLGITALPNEAYGSTGLEIKAKSPLRPTFNVDLANGYDGYLPPPDQHKLGGYTTWRARSSCLEVEAEPKVKAALLELLDRVAQQRSGEQLVPSKKTSGE